MSSRKTIILKKTKDFEYTLTGINREEYEEIEALMKMDATESDKYPFIADIYGCAHVSEVTEAILKEFITIHKVWTIKHEYSRFTTELIEFTCYVNRDRNPNVFSSNVIIHEDRLSALKCALSSLNTSYFYIIKKSIDKTYKQLVEEDAQKIIDDELTNNAADEQSTPDNIRNT